MRKIEGRKSYDAPPEGYRRTTIYIHNELDREMRLQAEKEGFSIRKFIEDALIRRIKYASYETPFTRDYVIERQKRLRCAECPIGKSE